MDKDQIINQQLRSQQLLISISTEYINADLQNIDGLINNSLQKMGEFVEADRSYIFSYNLTDNTTNNNTISDNTTSDDNTNKIIFASSSIKNYFKND